VGVRIGKIALGLVVVCGGLIPAGCRPAPLAFPASLNSPYADERVRAARTAADYPYGTAAERRVALEMLVGRLEDDDEAVRLFAIIALDKLTGTRLGYEYHATADERLRAVQSWRRYLDREARLADGPAGATQPVGPPAAQPKAAGHGARKP
jgi:hypothetical protein